MNRTATSQLQLTGDAAYKFQLWHTLWAASLSAARDGGGDANRHIAHHVAQVVPRLLRRHLPRRTYERCCLAGLCIDRKTGQHRGVHVGRARLDVGEDAAGGGGGVRDEFLACLAHTTACVGRPLALRMRGYRGSPGGACDGGHRGLRCLLRHVHVSGVEFTDVTAPRDAQAVVRELTRYEGARQKAQRGGVCARVRLCRLAAAAFSSAPSPSPPRCPLSRLLRAVARADHITELALQYCGLTAMTPLAAYVGESRGLARLSLRGNAALTAWPSLAAAVARNAGVVALDLAACDMAGPKLRAFLSAVDPFAPRPRFALDLSANALDEGDVALLTAAAAAFRAALTALALAEHNFAHGAREAALATLIDAYARLDELDVSQCVVPAGAMARLLRSAAAAGRSWRRLDCAAVGLLLAGLRRLAQLPFAADAALRLAGNALHGLVAKMALTNGVRQLATLDLSACGLTDEDLTQLAAALEKASPLPLRELRLDRNPLQVAGKKVESHFSYLCRALRQVCAPRLRLLSLDFDAVPLRPLLSFIEQVSATLEFLHLSHSSLAASANERTGLLQAVMRRQRGRLPFAHLDIWCEDDEGRWGGVDKDVKDWLATQSAIWVHDRSTPVV